MVNLWPNRLVGDAALPPEKRIAKTNIVFERSGRCCPPACWAPVRVMTEKDVVE